MSDSPTVRGKGIGLNHGAKSLLRNVIRHTDTHNRLLEESEMWQQFYRIRSRNAQDDDNQKEGKESRRVQKRERRGSRDSGDDGGFPDLDIQKSFLYDDRQEMRPAERSRRRGMKRAHMDDSSDDNWGSSTRGNGDASVSNVSGSTFWMRQLHKAEEGDPDRWGHAGFKELYPDAYASDRSDCSDGISKERKKKKKKQRYCDESKRKSQKQKKKSKKKKHKKDESDRKRHSDRKRKRRNRKDTQDVKSERSEKRKRSFSHSDSESEGKGAHGKVTKTDLSSDYSDSSSEESDQNKKKRRKNIKTENERGKETVESISRSESPRHKRKRSKH